MNAIDEKADVRKTKLKESQKKDGDRQGLKPEGLTTPDKRYFKLIRGRIPWVDPANDF